MALPNTQLRYCCNRLLRSACCGLNSNNNGDAALLANGFSRIMLWYAPMEHDGVPVRYTVISTDCRNGSVLLTGGAYVYHLHCFAICQRTV